MDNPIPRQKLEMLIYLSLISIFAKRNGMSQNRIFDVPNGSALFIVEDMKNTIKESISKIATLSFV
jgi:hypothetical protein